MTAIRGIRWFFNASKWSPSKEEWLLAVKCVQREELSRINRFVFKKDAKLALIGRLLLRSCAQSCLKTIDYKDIRFERTERGKPFIATNLIQSSGLEIDLNISHSGDYCVIGSIVSDIPSKLGVDVMRIEYSGQQSDRPLNDFFRLMNRQFSEKEWNFINNGSNEWQKLCRFIRLWTLKESFVKAEGIGIAFDLKRISFECPTPQLNTQTVTYDTCVRVDGSLLEDWLFEESLLDNKHCVCVASKPRLDFKPFIFSEKTITDILKEAVPLNSDQNYDQSLWTDFQNKLNKQ